MFIHHGMLLSDAAAESRRSTLWRSEKARKLGTAFLEVFTTSYASPSVTGLNMFMQAINEAFPPDNPAKTFSAYPLHLQCHHCRVLLLPLKTSNGDVLWHDNTKEACQYAGMFFRRPTLELYPVAEPKDLEEGER